MRALILLPLLAACASTGTPTGLARVDMTITPEMVAAQTTTRRETMVLAEHAYTGAILAAAQMVLASGALQDARLADMASAEARAGNALDYLRTLEDADDATFLWALHFYGVSIRDLNTVTEGEADAPAHAH